MLKRYQIFKSVLLDIEDYMEAGVSIDKIEDIIDDITSTCPECIWRPVDYLPIYEIHTTFDNDDDITDMINKILSLLDLELINTKIKSKIILN